jgi:signal transduction histidine kinase
MNTSFRETRFLAAAFLVLFAGLGVLSVFLLTGESSRARILVEYEADRAASTIADSYRVAGSLDGVKLDPRIRGFGLYMWTGEVVVRLGDAPPTLDPGNAQPGFRYDSGRGLLTLERLFGMGGPGMMGTGPNTGPRAPLLGRGMMGGMMGWPDGPGAPGLRGPSGFPRRGPAHGPAGAIFLSMDISSYYRSQLLYRTSAVIAPIVIAALAALFLLLLSSNIRHRRRAQEQDTLARLGESARTLAHEIRNPLGAIRIQSGLLRKKVPHDAAAQLDAIDEEVERLTLLSRRVADFLKNPRGDPVRILLDGFLKDLAGKLPTPVAYTAATEAQDAVVSFDGELLRSVIENLVRNAHESYVDAAGGIEMELSHEKGLVVISVRDRGKGIPPELAQKVFDPFFTDKVHGSGVGLSLSRRFIEAAGGTLTLMPRPGGGTEARIALPAGSAQ